MNILKTVYDKDVFPDPQVGIVSAWIERPTAKIIMFNHEGEIALIANIVNDYVLLPGGGIESKETPEQGALRECKEETGCEVKLLTDLGVTEDYRIQGTRHSLNFCYIGRVVSYGEARFTETEQDVGAHVVWVSLKRAIEIFEDQQKSLTKSNIRFYNTGFNIIRDAFFLKKAEEWLERNSISEN